MIAVKFLKGMAPYNAGEIAGFSAEEAQRLIQAGVAEEYKTKAKEEPPVDKMIDTAPNKPASRPVRK